MIFLNPEYLLLMLLPSFVLFFFIFSSKVGLEQYFEPQILEKLRLGGGLLGKKGRNIFLFLTLFLSIIALSRPVIELEEQERGKKSLNILIAIDVSRSMFAKDVYPDRFLFAKNKASRLMELFKEANFGIVGFSGGVFLISPITSDQTSAKYMLQNFDETTINSKNSDFQALFESCDIFFQNSKNKIIIMFTDGGDERSLNEELKSLKKSNITLYTILIGKNKPIPIEFKGELVKDDKDEVVLAPANPKISQLSLQSQGAFANGVNSDEDLEAIIQEVKNKFQNAKKDEGVEKLKDYNELFYYPLGLAIFSLLIALTSPPKIGTLAILFFAFSPLYSGILDFYEIDRANKKYNLGDFNASVDSFQKIVQSKNSPQSFYDLGNAHYKNKNFKEALNAYENAKTQDQNLEFNRLFNISNTKASLGDFEGAINSINEALSLKKDTDAQHNLETLIKLKKQKEEQKEKEKNGQNKSEKQKNENEKNNDKDKNKQKNNSEQKEQEDKPEHIQQSQEGEEEEEEKSQGEGQGDLMEKKWEKYLNSKKPTTKPVQIQDEKRGIFEEVNPW